MSITTRLESHHCSIQLFQFVVYQRDHRRTLNLHCALDYSEFNPSWSHLALYPVLVARCRKNKLLDFLDNSWLLVAARSPNYVERISDWKIKHGCIYKRSNNQSQLRIYFIRTCNFCRISLWQCLPFRILRTWRSSSVSVCGSKVPIRAFTLSWKRSVRFDPPSSIRTVVSKIGTDESCESSPSSGAVSSSSCPDVPTAHEGTREMVEHLAGEQGLLLTALLDGLFPDWKAAISIK